MGHNRRTDIPVMGAPRNESPVLLGNVAVAPSRPVAATRKQRYVAHGLVVKDDVPRAVSLDWPLMVFDGVGLAVAQMEQAFAEARSARSAAPDADMSRADLDEEAEEWVSRAGVIDAWLRSDRQGICGATQILAVRTNLRPAQVRVRSDFDRYLGQALQLARPAGTDSYCEFVLLTDGPIPQLITTRLALAEHCGDYVEGQLVEDMVLQERMSMHVGVGMMDFDERRVRLSV